MAGAIVVASLPSAEITSYPVLRMHEIPFVSRIFAWRSRLNKFFIHEDSSCRAVLLLLLLLGLGSCNQGPSTACITPQTTCALDVTYAPTGTACHCGDSKGEAVTR
jgi:hypothetical protein